MASDDLSAFLQRVDEQWDRAGQDPARAALPVSVRVTEDAIVVGLAEWTRSFELDDDDEREGILSEALDLVAAAVHGRAMVKVHTVRDVDIRWDVHFGEPGSWTLFDTTRRGRAWLRKASTRELCNPRSQEIQLGDAGHLPYAPWIGTLAGAQDANAAAEIPIDGELDLHPFKPKEVGPLCREYVDECARRGITELRLVHGKGIGALRRTVHAMLDKHPAVQSYRLGGTGEGSWGATIVKLKPPEH